MTTVSQFINSARYDLRDYQTGLEFDDEELLEYINRMRLVLDSTLTSLNSSHVHATDTTVDLLINTNSVDIKTNLNSGNWDSIRSVWIGSNRLEKISVDLMYYKRKFISGKGQPQFWAHEGDNLIFEQTADQKYDLIIHYNRKTAVLALTSNMPYSDRFNEIFRELLVMHAKAKKEGAMGPSEQTYQAIFRRVTFENQIRVDFKPKYYHIDF